MSRALSELFKEGFYARGLCRPHREPVNRPQSRPFNLEQDQSAFSTAKVSREDHVCTEPNWTWPAPSSAGKIGEFLSDDCPYVGRCSCCSKSRRIEFVHSPS